MPLRAFTLACSIPWAITPEALQQILEISTREHLPDFEAVAAKRSRRMDGAESARLREGGVAVVPVTGPIFRYADFFTDFSGGATIDSLSKDFNAALNDPAVASIVLNIDSPGGEVAGVNEFAQMVFEARGRKPIVAYVDGLGASAAYWIASAADEIVADATAMIGSIGVVAAWPNPEKKSAREIEFVSSQSPKKRPNPILLTPGVLAFLGRRDGKVANGRSLRRVSQFRVTTQVANDSDLVERHFFLPSGIRLKSLSLM
jgi:ATP-dependent protease ClpP protease subunit